VNTLNHEVRSQQEIFARATRPIDRAVIANAEHELSVHSGYATAQVLDPLEFGHAIRDTFSKVSRSSFQSAQNKSELAEVMTFKRPLGFCGLFQLKGSGNVDFKRSTIDQFIQLGKRLRVGLSVIARHLHVTTLLRNVLHAIGVSGSATFP
jgi:hypothetical protein